jgi:hypothetical protein
MRISMKIPWPWLKLLMDSLEATAIVILMSSFPKNIQINQDSKYVLIIDSR